MLLSHNFDITPGVVPALSRKEFCEVFRAGLMPHPNLHCRLLDHPHWTVEIVFAPSEFSPQPIGELCAQALAAVRSPHLPSGRALEILILGGLKTTPPTSDSPDALQPGEWGVDVVETRSGDAFLERIAWEATISQKPADGIFKVERKVIG
jgi:Protein of unknown function (DUF2656)